MKRLRTLRQVRIGCGDLSRPLGLVGAPFCNCRGRWHVATRCRYCWAPGCGCRETCPDCFEAGLRTPGAPA
jgi:hypothetical protein